MNDFRLEFSREIDNFVNSLNVLLFIDSIVSLLLLLIKFFSKNFLYICERILDVINFFDFVDFDNANKSFFVEFFRKRFANETFVFFYYCN